MQGEYSAILSRNLSTAQSWVPGSQKILIPRTRKYSTRTPTSGVAHAARDVFDKKGYLVRGHDWKCDCGYRIPDDNASDIPRRNCYSGARAGVLVMCKDMGCPLTRGSNFNCLKSTMSRHTYPWRSVSTRFRLQSVPSWSQTTEANQ